MHCGLRDSPRRGPLPLAAGQSPPLVLDALHIPRTPRWLYHAPVAPALANAVESACRAASGFTELRGWLVIGLGDDVCGFRFFPSAEVLSLTGSRQVRQQGIAKPRQAGPWPRSGAKPAI